MAENFILPAANTRKESRYEMLLPQLEALITGEKDVIANLANLMAALKSGMNFFWAGCYFVKGEELVLGPFQGTVACTRIAFGKGVCGTCWKEKRPILVPDVDAFPGHIACSSASRSEIVLPVFREEKVAMVLDIDSDRLADFDETDLFYLQKVATLMEAIIQ